MLKIGIIGATGYVGAEIVRLLALRDDIRLLLWYRTVLQGSLFLLFIPL